jgi:hypothetical protein
MVRLRPFVSRRSAQCAYASISLRIERRLAAPLGERKTCLLFELVFVDNAEFYLGGLPIAPVAKASVAAADKAVL